MVPFDACLGTFTADDILEGYESAAAGGPVQGRKTTRFKTFPPYLMVHLQKCAPGCTMLANLAARCGLIPWPTSDTFCLAMRQERHVVRLPASAQIVSQLTLVPH